MSDETDSEYWHSDEELESAPVLAALLEEFVANGHRMQFSKDVKWQADAASLLNAAAKLKMPQALTDSELQSTVKGTMNSTGQWADKMPPEFLNKFDLPYMDFGVKPTWLPYE